MHIQFVEAPPSPGGRALKQVSPTGGDLEGASHNDTLDIKYQFQ
jgi:hypothetical protein